MENTSNNRCVGCHQEINEKAVKCHHCGTSQGLSRFLSVPTIIIAIISGVSSLTILLTPVAKEVFGLTDSKFVVEYVSDTDNSISFMISNIGEKPGFISHFRMPFKSSLEFDSPKLTGGAIMLKSGESELLELTPKVHPLIFPVERLAKDLSVDKELIKENLNGLGITDEEFEIAYRLYDIVGKTTFDQRCIIAARKVSYRGKSEQLFILKGTEISHKCNWFRKRLFNSDKFGELWMKTSYMIDEINKNNNRL